MTCGYIVMLYILVSEVLPFEVVQPVDGVGERDGDCLNWNVFSNE
jgi:hypothetical protein